MVHIYYTIFEEERAAEELEALLQQMPKSITERVERYRQDINKYQLVYGRMLINKLFQDLGYTNFNLKDLQYTSFNKPFWRADLDFSIAHSGHIVGCALSTKGNIGLDIEKVQSIDINNFGHILNIEDQQFLSASTNLKKDFFKIWTIKEAVSKADGRGLSMEVKDIFIGMKEATCFTNTWHTQEIDVHPDYKCHFAINTPLIKEAIIKKVEF